jgi:hypothetical protein
MFQQTSECRDLDFIDQPLSSERARTLAILAFFGPLSVSNPLSVTEASRVFFRNGPLRSAP